MRILWVAALAVAAISTGALAQTDSMGSSMKAQTGSMSSMHGMGGSMHTMPATVTSVDQKTGMMEVSSAGMALKLHFPPASVAQVKVGDKITLHLAFTKP